MDSKTFRDQAERAPEAFSQMEEGKVKIIDEVQKVPDLFDAIKLHVDKQRRPGSYIISGSTQFSQLTGIRESLTGRIGILHLYPFNLSEIWQKPYGSYFTANQKVQAQLSLKEFEKKLTHGGMPGFFYLHSEDEFEAACQLWIETTCFRDLSKVIKQNFDGELALNILTELAKAEIPTATEVATELGKDRRVIQRYIDGFVQILVVKRISPISVGVGKDQYLLVDSGLTHFLGGHSKNVLRSHVLIEALSHFESRGIARPIVSYYATSKSSFVPLILEWKNKNKILIIQISDKESPSRSELGSLDSLLKNLNPKLNKRILFLTHTSESYVEGGIEFHPLRG
jgi:predicted AAA+ superfamily ATPase